MRTSDTRKRFLKYVINNLNIPITNWGKPLNSDLCSQRLMFSEFKDNLLYIVSGQVEKHRVPS